MKSRFTLIAIVASASLVACANFAPTATSSRLPAAPVLAPVDPSTVVLFRDAAGPYSEIAKIRIAFKAVRWQQDVMRDPEVVDALRREAARVGADGVTSIVFVPRTSWNSAHEPAFGREYPVGAIVATAVRRAPVDTDSTPRRHS